MTMRALLSIAVALLVAVPVIAKDVPLSVKVGKLCVIRAESRVSFLPASPPTWEMSIHDGGQTCVLSTEKPETVVLFGIHGSADGAPPEIDRWIITIGDGDAPAPDPDNPVDPVDPIDPNVDSLVPDKWEMGKFAYASALKLKDKKGAENLYRIWGNAAKSMAAIDPSVSATERYDRHDAIWQKEVSDLADKYASKAWMPWREAMQTRIQAAENNGKFPLPKDTAAMMTEVATALRIIARGK